MNIRLAAGPHGIEVGGRTARAQIPARLLEGIAALGLDEVLPDDMTLYGEGYGARIQKGGGNYRQDNGFVLFDVRVDGFWLRREDVVDVATRMGLDVVPQVGRGTIQEAANCVRRGLRSHWGEFMAEGLVLRPVVPLYDHQGKRIICKVKHVDIQRMYI